ncbi:oxidoreductase [Exilibacterium tricleocarpae]|uniref:Oxidoreductase n=1 Tax=Exilibacterium tricleocarpae TaxID=2591008 RepID=A0A545SSX9_9GAMM|nr:PQQ-dependent sugar dehydrogenase [Exilibacterium tricleocarpae]TQV68056.1 oxidoreductase [Exilibacterium tricleocarpae]
MGALLRTGKLLGWLCLLAIAGLAGLLLLFPSSLGVSIPWGQIIGAELDREATRQRLRLAPGFQYSIYADQLPGARLLRLAPNGDLLVSQPRAGRITLLLADRNGDGQADGSRILIEGLTRPHGLDFYQDWLYIAESDAVGRVRFDTATGNTTGAYERLLTGLGDKGNHWTKTLRLGPDNWFYLTSGSTCNVCIEEDPQRATMLRFRPDGSELSIYASGLRNAVGFDWAPWNGHLYATDNGRDFLGDDFPPCELNRVEQGLFYGWPYANGDNIPDPDYGAGNADKIATAIAPRHGFRAHTAPLGITFLADPTLPSAYRRSALVALHGSWNRTEKDGYEVVALHWAEDGRISEQQFFWGFEEDGDVIGRPVDIAGDGAGSIFVSDDYVGAIYRISAGSAAAPAATSNQTRGTLAEEHFTPAQISAGRQLYIDQDCQSCHRELPLVNLQARYDSGGLARFFDAPTPPMPRVSLSEPQKLALAAYLLAGPE